MQHAFTHINRWPIHPICYPIPFSIYAATSEQLWPTFHHYKCGNPFWFLDRRALKQRMGTNANNKIPKINLGRGSCFRMEITFETKLNQSAKNTGHSWYVPSGVDHNEESSCSNKMPLDLAWIITGKNTQSRSTYIKEHACTCVFNVDSRYTKNELFFAFIAFLIRSLHHAFIGCMEIWKTPLSNLRLTAFNAPIAPSKRHR